MIAFVPVIPSCKPPNKKSGLLLAAVISQVANLTLLVKLKLRCAKLKPVNRKRIPESSHL